MKAPSPRITFDQAYSRLKKSEGGFQKDPNDRANWTTGIIGKGELKGTKYGISAMTYPDLDIVNLTPEQAKAIYYRDWWLKIGGDHFDPAIVFQLWEFAVLAGMDNAKRCLQRAGRVADDGDIGPLTIKTICAMDLNDVLFRFNAAKLRHFTSLSIWPNYGKGWTNRTADRLDDCATDNIDLPESSKWVSSQVSPPNSSPGSSELPQSSVHISASGEVQSVKGEPKPTPNSPPAMPTGGFWQMIGQMLKFGKP